MEPAAVHEWTKKDKLLYFLSLLPMAAVFIGTAILLASYSIFFTAVLIALYLLANVFQAGCCVGCPYRGGYCPALCGVYLGNLFSNLFYRHRGFDPRFFEINAAAGGTMILVTALFPLYWVYKSGWYLVPIYILLIAAHFALFMPTQCEKCGYNRTCPGGRAWLGYRARRRGNAKSARIENLFTD